MRGAMIKAFGEPTEVLELVDVRSRRGRPSARCWSVSSMRRST